jgi:hypothetical protein
MNSFDARRDVCMVVLLRGVFAPLPAPVVVMVVETVVVVCMCMCMSM